MKPDKRILAYPTLEEAATALGMPYKDVLRDVRDLSKVHNNDALIAKGMLNVDLIIDPTIWYSGRKLSARQRLFVAHYVVDWNGARAVRAAGYSEKGDSAQAVRLLRIGSVAAAVDEYATFEVTKCKRELRRGLRHIQTMSADSPELKKIERHLGRLVQSVERCRNAKKATSMKPRPHPVEPVDDGEWHLPRRYPEPVPETPYTPSRIARRLHRY